MFPRVLCIHFLPVPENMTLPEHVHPREGRGREREGGGRSSIRYFMTRVEKEKQTARVHAFPWNFMRRIDSKSWSPVGRTRKIARTLREILFTGRENFNFSCEEDRFTPNFVVPYRTPVSFAKRIKIFKFLRNRLHWYNCVEKVNS